MRAFHKLSLPSGFVAAGLAAIVCAAAWPSPATAEIPAVVARQRAEKTNFTDAEIVDGFLKTAFGAEYHLAGRVDRIRKYTMPVRVFADGGRADRKAQLAKVVVDIGQHIQHIDIAIVERRGDANVHVIQRICHHTPGAHRAAAGCRKRRSGDVPQIAAHEIAFDFKPEPIADPIANREVGIEPVPFIQLDLTGAEARPERCRLGVLRGVQACAVAR